MRSLLAVACCVFCMLVLPGCPPGTADKTIHVDSNCSLVYADGSSADPLELSPGDKVRWVNDTDDRVFVAFGTTELFGRDGFRLNPRGSTVTRVKSSAAGYDSDFRVDCGEDGGSGNPKVKVGDDEGGGG